ncbi:MAG: 16S rRNA (guanine(966)-N(2))-methyltransferase RsmD [Desulfobacteraceae bacterium]|nr:MAG: 16S rRNA (guanine(966)-N(2))-methyltransferase RsmD [Desulfobacteraceae bacterium]
MRIISGRHRGRKLKRPENYDIRPTSDRAREAVFNSLGTRSQGARVLDLFAGTGAMGLEAISRGAKEAIFIDSSPLACRIVEENIRRCREEDVCQVLCLDILDIRPLKIPKGPYDLIFMDPPYEQGFLGQVFRLAWFRELMHPDTVIVADHSIKENPFAEMKGLDILRQKKYSKSFVTFLRNRSI